MYAIENKWVSGITTNVLGFTLRWLGVQQLNVSGLSLVAPALGLFATFYLLGFAGLKFTEPASLTGDHVFVLNLIKESMNGVGVFNENLGAPGKNFNLHHPLFDGSYKALIWVFSRFTSNVFLVVSLLYVAGVALMFGACFW